MTDAPPALPHTDEDWRVERGVCRFLVVYDLGWSIQLAALEPVVAEWRRPAPPAAKGRTPARIDIRPEPLRLEIPCESVAVGHFRTSGAVVARAYEFGAVSLGYEIPIAGRAEALIGLARELVDNRALLAHSRTVAERLLARFGGTVAKPSLWSRAEDYAIFHVESSRPALPPDALLARFGARFAQILRSEESPLAPEEVERVLAARISFGPGDLSVVDWNAALVIDPEGEDTVAIIEFGNVQLLEARFLDEQLDRALERAYEVLARHKSARGWPRPSHGEELWRVAELQVEAAVLFGRVGNALKLVGEPYLARVYRLLSERFHLAEWNAGHARKLAAIEAIYDKLSDRAATRRMEILEWIIIVLFLISIAVSLWPGLAH